MTAQLISPAGLLHPVPYHHVAIGTGTRQVHIAGQTARPADGGPIASENLGDQISVALRQIHTALVGVGGTFADVVRMTFYVPDWNPDKIDDLTRGINAVTAELGIPDPWPPMTLIGVAALWEPDIKVEIEAFATLS